MNKEQVIKPTKERVYSEEDLRKAFHCGRLYLGREGDTTIEQFIESLKK